jgi:hypothetical protein
MQAEKQVSSPRDKEVEGFGTQRSKQCSFTFFGVLVRRLEPMSSEGGRDREGDELLLIVLRLLVLLLV